MSPRFEGLDLAGGPDESVIVVDESHRQLTDAERADFERTLRAACEASTRTRVVYIATVRGDGS